ncbi:MAG TPA: gephyrin-like molybdotransferase Glp [Pseudomonadales bacterium]
MNESRLDLDQALDAILADARPASGEERVAVAAALGRVLARSIDAPVSLPPFAASAMDGYALRRGDVDGEPPYRLRLAGTSYAGHPVDAPTPPGSCVRIFTGAPVPADLDTVVIQENCAVEGDRIRIDVRVAAGDNIRPVGHDIAAGQRLLDRGRRLNAFDVGWLAACGIAHVDVHTRPVVGLFSTGDELIDAGTAPRPGQIFDSNRRTLISLLAPLPVAVKDYGIVPDRRERIRDVLEQADAECDVVLTTGGVSVGDADWVKDVVSEIGRLRIWKLNIKPGKPLAYGRLSRAAFFGLPGNPVSTIVTALMLALPAIERVCGTEPSPPLTVPATLRGAIRHQPGREEFQRGRLSAGDDGLQVAATGDQSSNRLASFADANCLIRIPKDCGDVADGSRVRVLPFRGLI